MAGWNRRRVGAGWCVAGLLFVLVAGCAESPGLARRKTTRGPVPPRGGDPSARIAALIGELDQIEAGDYGMIGGENPNKDPIVVNLIAEGEPAVEPLLVALATDDRLTKTTIWDHGKNQGLLPVSRLVHYALKRLMKTNRFSQAGQFSKQGDEAELTTPEGRKRLAGLAREFWRKNRGVPLGERFYRYLADDDAAPLCWVEAAAGLVAPTDDGGVPDVTYVNLGRPTRAAPGQPRHGDVVKDRVPTVSDLLAQRAAELAGNGPARTIPDQGLIRASKLGLLFVSWDERAELATIKRLRLALRVSESGTLAITGRVVGPDGRPVAGAVVNVFHRTPYAGGSGAYGGRVRFDNLAEVRTGPDGTYRTPRELRRGIAYRVEVAAADRPPALGPFVELAAGAGPTRVFPDVLLGGPTRAR
jgi:hypothetical protein